MASATDAFADELDALRSDAAFKGKPCRCSVGALVPRVTHVPVYPQLHMDSTPHVEPYMLLWCVVGSAEDVQAMIQMLEDGIACFPDDDTRSLWLNSEK